MKFINKPVTHSSSYVPEEKNSHLQEGKIQMAVT